MNDPMIRDKGHFTVRSGNKNTRVWEIWNHIKRRCYHNSGNGRDISYIGCTVSPEFYSFQSFSSWAELQTGFFEEFQIDKDLLVKGNKIYSPETCIFVPAEINSALLTNPSRRTGLPIGVQIRNDQPMRPYMAFLNRSRKKIFLGSFKNPDQAFYAYKDAKETYLKELAYEYRGYIDPRAYAALIDYRIEITD